tara:strand:- start:79 stop:759 length:681 start_codon:yes stop_codon:yes gene_type:complete
MPASFDLYVEPPNGNEDYLVPMFSTPLLHLKVDGWEEKKQKLLSMYHKRQAQKDKFKIACGKEESHDVETDYHYNYDNDIDYGDIIAKLFREELETLCDTFECAVEVSTAWFEKAKRGKQHTVHNHGVDGFSAVCFIEFDPKYHTPTVFMNPNVADDQITNFIPPGIREGSLIFFPSWCLHYTAPNTSDVDRVILSFNMAADYGAICFEDENGAEAEFGEYVTNDV